MDLDALHFQSDLTQTMITYLCSYEYSPSRNTQVMTPAHTTPTMDIPKLLATVPHNIPSGRNTTYIPSIHDILYLVAHKADQNGLIIASKDIQDSRHDLHHFYNTWSDYHKEFTKLLDNSDYAGVDTFLNKHPNFNRYTDIIKCHVQCCHDLILSPDSTPSHFIQLQDRLWSNLMNLTWLNFKDEIGSPEVPTIYTRALNIVQPENYKNPIEVQQPGAPI